MNDPKHYICIIGAIGEEIAGIKQRMQIEQSLALGHARVFIGRWQGVDLLLVRSGVGRARARQALAQVCDSHAVGFILSIGYAGGLDPSLNVGDLVIADKVFDHPSDATDEKSLRGEIISTALVSQAMALPRPADTVVVRGALLTVDRVVPDPAAKKELGSRYPVQAVDMETTELAREAAARNIPFLSIRSITDTVNQQLLDCAHLVKADGEVSKLKAGWHVLTHPGDLKNMVALRGHAQKATARLTEFLMLYLKNHKAGENT